MHLHRVHPPIPPLQVKVPACRVMAVTLLDHIPGIMCVLYLFHNSHHKFLPSSLVIAAPSSLALSIYIYIKAVQPHAPTHLADIYTQSAPLPQELVICKPSHSSNPGSAPPLVLRSDQMRTLAPSLSLVISMLLRSRVLSPDWASPGELGVFAIQDLGARRG